MTSNGKTIVIADDDETFVMYLSILLHRMGFEVIPVKNGEEVMRLLGTIRPDVVITDYKMPLMDGLTTLKKILEDQRFSHIPVIAMSAYCDQKIHDEFINAGVKGFLTKPIKVKALIDLIQECVIYENYAKRKNLRCSYRKKIIIEHNSHHAEYNAVSLSEGGIYLRTQTPLPVGSSVRVLLELPLEHSIKAQGTVIYQKTTYMDVFKIDPGMAIQFENLSAGEANMLHTYIIDILVGDLKSEQQREIIECLYEK